MVLSISRGSDWTYVTKEVGQAAGNYYSAAVQAGEPAGVWRGSAAEALGLTGVANDLQMEALFGNFVDPTDPNFLNRDAWAQAQHLGSKPYRYKTREEILVGLMAAEPNPADIEPERMKQLELQAGRDKREARAFFDLTYSPPKSVTAAYVACKDQEAQALDSNDEAAARVWSGRAAIIEDSVWKASGEIIKWMEDKAGHSRAANHGAKLKSGETAGRYIEAGKFTVASFLQHTSRPIAGKESPQLHVHNLVLNRIKCADGKWRSLDGKALYGWRGGASAIGDREVMADLTKRLGMEFRYDPQSKSHEVVGISRDVRDVFSPRRAAITKALPKYVEAFTTRMGREPNALELSDLAQRATLHTRKGKLRKDQATTLGDKVQLWSSQVQEKLGVSLASAAAGMMRRPGTVQAKVFDPQQVIDAAVESVQAVKAEWSRSDLIGHLQRQLPGVITQLETGMQGRLLDELATMAVAPNPAKVGTDAEVICMDVPDIVAAPAELTTDRKISFHRPNSAKYSTVGLQKQEQQIKAAAAGRNGAARLTAEQAATALERINAQLAGPDGTGTARLGDDQAAALRGILTSGARLETMIGPAGTGKSFVMGNLAHAWERETGGRVYGLATAQTAADVLQSEGLANTDNIAKWLATQDGIQEGTVKGRRSVRWSLRPGDLVIVDEASMADTPSLARIQEYAAAAGAKLLLVGDDKQLGAPGAGGSFVLAAEAGNKYELSEVRRFHSAWEREASLRLRDGDEAVISEYEAHDRVVECRDMEHAIQEASRAYLSDTLDGKRAYLTVDTNEQATDLSNQIRAELIEYEMVTAEGVPIAHNGNRSTAGTGDIVQARDIDRNITNKHGQFLTNRGLYKVVYTDADNGSMTVMPMSEDGRLGAPIEVPSWYAQESMSLAYAMTAHGAEGKTGATCYGIVTPLTSAGSGYVQLTRGRETNVAFVVDTNATEGDTERKTATEILAEVIARDTSTEDRSATQALHDNQADAGSMRVIGHRYFEANTFQAEKKYENIITEVLSDHDAKRFRGDDAKDALYRLMDTLDQAGYDAPRVVQKAIASRELATADSIAQVVHSRITKQFTTELDNAKTTGKIVLPEPTGDSYTERIVAGPEGLVAKYARDYAALADERATTLGEIAADTPPQWALDKFGAAPEDPADRLEWTRKVGTVEAFREHYGITDDPDVIGRAPSIHQPAVRGEWYAAWRALGRPDQAAEELRMTDEQLQARIGAYEKEKEWAPPSVADDLKEATRQHRGAEQSVQHLTAQARILPAADPQRATLESMAAKAAERAARFADQKTRLERVHEVRDQWHNATTEPRAAADSAARELKRREQDRAAETTATTPVENEADTEHHTAERAANQRQTPTAEQTADQTTETDNAQKSAQTADATPAPAAAAFPQTTAEAVKQAQAKKKPEPVNIDAALAAAERAAAKLAAQGMQKKADEAAKERNEEYQRRQAYEAAERAARRDGPGLSR